MSVISTLRDILRQVRDETPVEHEERLTVAALLILVAHADGRVLPVETEGLEVLLSSRFGLARDAARAVLADAAAIEAGIDPSTSLIDRIVHDVPFDERGPLLSLAYRVAAIDGVVHDFEDDLIWRTGRLLGFSDRDLSDLKADAIKNLRPGAARG
jgi:uncharacterized tellurite resistance protein B-like protein